MSSIRDLIRELAKGDGEAYSVICTVDAVDKDARTVDCTPIDEGAPLLGVNLQANQGSSLGVVSFPRVGSYVVVGFVAGGSAGVVLLTDDIESMEITTAEDKSRAVIDDDGVRINVGEETSAELTADGIVLNGGSLGGLVILEKIKKNLDQLKKYAETMKSAVSSGLKAVGAGTAANGMTGASAFDGAMSSAIISFEDMENEKVKQ